MYGLRKHDIQLEVTAANNSEMEKREMICTMLDMITRKEMVVSPRLLVASALKGFISLSVEACMQGCERDNIAAIFHWLLWIAPHNVQQLLSMGQLFLPLGHRVSKPVCRALAVANRKGVIKQPSVSFFCQRFGVVITLVLRPRHRACRRLLWEAISVGALAPLEPSWPG